MSARTTRQLDGGTLGELGVCLVDDDETRGDLSKQLDVVPWFDTTRGIVR
jgi:hypothetical protein